MVRLLASIVERSATVAEAVMIGATGDRKRARQSFTLEARDI